MNPAPESDPFRVMLDAMCTGWADFLEAFSRGDYSASAPAEHAHRVAVLVSRAAVEGVLTAIVGDGDAIDRAVWAMICLGWPGPGPRGLESHGFTVPIVRKLEALRGQAFGLIWLAGADSALADGARMCLRMEPMFEVTTE